MNWGFFLTFFFTALEIENSSLDQVFQALISYYGTDEKLNEIYTQPFKYGQRNFSRSSAPTGLHGKKALLYVMKLYYITKNIILTGNPNADESAIDDNLDKRYGNTYATVRSFVNAQILAGRSEVPSWSDLSRRTRDAYSLLVEDYVERTLGADRDGLPLFCTDKHYAANFFLTTILRNSKGRGTNNREPPVPVSFTYIYLQIIIILIVYLLSFLERFSFWCYWA